MRLFSVGGTQIVCSPFILVLIFLCCITEAWDYLAVSFLSLSAHEMAHAFVARRLGYHTVQIEIQPFGFVARMNSITSRSDDELAIALAGPVCSLILGTAAVGCLRVIEDPHAIVMLFCKFNMTIALFNLLPALPLDGGRILRALCSKKLRPRAATLLGAWIGVAAGAALIGAGAVFLSKGMLNLSFFLVGVFLIPAAFKEMRNAQGAQLTAMFKRKDIFSGGGVLNMKQIVAHKSMRACEALKSFSGNRYNLIIVVDDNMLRIGELDEGELLKGIAERGSDVLLGKLVKRD